MGAFVVLRAEPGRADPPRQALDYFRAAGFAAPRRIDTPHWHVLVYPKLERREANVYVHDSTTFAFATGTLLYKGATGQAALQRIVADMLDRGIAWAELRGAYALGVAHGDRLMLSCDRLGVYKAYHDADWRVAASSFLAVLATIGKPAADAQGVYEYVFQEATYGGRTVIDQIKIFDRRARYELAREASRQAIPDEPHPTAVRRSFDEHVERNRSVLRGWFKDIAACFGDRIDTALSGGYDSRLILALLREQGITPRIHVYGGSGDPDVRVAMDIARGESLRLVHVDKSEAATPAPEAFARIVERNCVAMDGYPADGIFENGTDLATRRDRAADDALALNGGGGEIYRNFFYLPDRALTPREFIWCFYSQYDPASCTSAFSEAAYVAALAAAIRRTLGRDVDVLSRADIEYLYPTFRCGYWMGRNNSVNSRFGPALTPFIEAHVVAEALQVPIAMKNYGRFEAALIRATDPALARYPSAYGDDFMSPISLRRKLKDQMTMLRPPLLRRYSFRLRSRLRPAPRPPLLSRPHLDRVVDPALPIVSRYFRSADVRDNGQFARLCTLEYLFMRYAVAT